MIHKFTIIGILGALILTSCSMQKTVASYGDFFLKRQLKSYVNLNDQQEEQVDLLVDKIWTQLKSQWIDDLANKSIQNLSSIKSEFAPNHYNRINQDFRAFTINLLDTYHNEISSILLSLNAKQINELEVYFKELNEERSIDKDLTAKERHEKYFERTIASFEKWYGDASEQQKRQLQVEYSQIPPFLKTGKSRKSVQKNLIELLKQKPNPKRLITSLKTWTSNPELMRSPDVRPEYLQIREFFKNRTIYFNKIASAEQKQKAHKKISEIINDIKEGVKDS